MNRLIDVNIDWFNSRELEVFAKILRYGLQEYIDIEMADKEGWDDEDEREVIIQMLTHWQTVSCFIPLLKSREEGKI